jgi:hypothetical protein
VERSHGPDRAREHLSAHAPVAEKKTFFHTPFRGCELLAKKSFLPHREKIRATLSVPGSPATKKPRPPPHKEDTMKTTNTAASIYAIQDIVDQADKLRNAYFFQPPQNASGRRSYEAYNSRP